MSRIFVLAAIYFAAYLASSWADLTTTSLALLQPGASEGNHYATTSAGYDASRAWLITFGAAVFLEGWLIAGALNAGKVSDRWIARPLGSFAKFYINPLARGVIDRSPIHMLSYAFALVLLRFMAAGNNVLIWQTGWGPLGNLIGFVGHYTTPMLAFWLVLGPLFQLLAMLLSPLAVRTIAWLRRD